MRSPGRELQSHAALRAVLRRSATQVEAAQPVEAPGPVKSEIVVGSTRRLHQRQDRGLDVSG
jgi:hypothetical protein